MNFDISSTPFSRFGEFVSLGLSGDESGPFLLVRNMRVLKTSGHLLGIRFLKNSDAVPFSVYAEPHALSVSSPLGNARIYIRPHDTVVVESADLDIELKLLRAGFGFPEGPGRYKFYVEGVYIPVGVQAGIPNLRLDRYMHEDGIQRITHVSLKIGCSGRRALVHFALQWQEKPLVGNMEPERDLEDVRRQWQAFREMMPAVPAERAPVAELAWYTLWSAFVRPEGHIKYDACLMSKATMSALWSWDHCFNALAIAQADPMLGLQQLLLPFELQSETGQIPDRWSSLVSTWMVTKPPIHGWCLGKLLARFPDGSGVPAPEMLQKLYGHLEKWTEFWFSQRDTDGDGIPNYVWGLDSGWDNATLFDPALCPESPDLAAFLVLQMDVLADLATRLGMKAEAARWRSRADQLLAALLEHSWRNDRFVAPVSRSHDFDPSPTSLLALMPLVLGQRLERSKRERLISFLEEDFLTDHGPATESPSSPLYLANGYWRGPIWAPSTYLLVDGLARGGHLELAREIARKFCDMVEQAGGHYENYDALSGKGLCDQGYTWTASVHLLLLNEYLLPDEREGNPV